MSGQNKGVAAWLHLIIVASEFYYRNHNFFFTLFVIMLIFSLSFIFVQIEVEKSIFELQ